MSNSVLRYNLHVVKVTNLKLTIQVLTTVYGYDIKNTIMIYEYQQFLPLYRCVDRYIDIQQCVYPGPAEGHWGSIQFGAIMDKGAMNTQVHVFV